MYVDRDNLRKRVLLIFILCKTGSLTAAHRSCDIPTTIKIEMVKQIFWIGLVILGYKTSSSLSINSNLFRVICAISKNRYNPSTKNRTRMRWLKMECRVKCLDIKHADIMFNRKPTTATPNTRTNPIKFFILPLGNNF